MNSTKTLPLGKRDRTRLAIINAAMQIIAKKGLDAASIDDLMAQADMARGTFYNYFQTREEVLDAVVEHLREHLHEAIESRIPDKLSSEAIIACMIYGLYHHSMNNPCLGRVIVRLGADNDWFSPYDLEAQHFPRADAAVLDLIKDKTQFPIALTFIEGVGNNHIRRSLQQPTADSIDSIAYMILLGLGADKKNIKPALKSAQEFAILMQEVNTDLTQ